MVKKVGMLGLAILFSLLVIPSIFAETNATLTFESKDYNVNITDEFNVTIVLDTDVALGALQFNVTWDPEYLEYVGYTDGEAVQKAMSQTNDEKVNEGYLKPGYISTEGINSGKVITITFKAKKGGDATITLNVEDVSDVKGAPISINPSDTTTVHIYAPKPDLTITDVSAELKAYEENAIKVEVKNVGETDASNVTVDLYVDANKIGEQTIDSLKVNEAKIVTFTFMPIGEKNYTIVAVVDPNNKIDEKNESNNEFVKVLYAVEKSIAVNVVSSSTLVKAGETFTVDIKLDNVTEKRPVKGIDGTLLYNSDVLECTNFTFLVNASENLKNITIGDGKVTFSIMDGNITTPTVIARATFKAIGIGSSVIALDGVAISDANGYKFNKVVVTSATVTVEGPDACIEDITVENPYYREPAVVKVKVSNKGHADSIESFNVHLYIDSEDLGIKEIANLSVGETKVVEFNWIPTHVKNYTIVATIDPTVDENISNNKMVKIVAVEERAISVNVISPTLAKTNDVFTVDIKLDNVTEKRPVKGIDGVLTYNSDVLECINFTFLVNASEGLENVTIDKGKVTFSIMDGNITKPTTIARVTFKAVDVGKSDIALSDVKVSDANGYKFNKVVVNPAVIKVEGPNINVQVSVNSPAIYRINNPITVTVTNNGHQDITTPFDIRVYINSEELGNATVSSLKVGESKVVTFNWTPTELREYTIVVVADTANSIKEEDEDDNKIVKTVKVVEIPVFIKMYKASENEGSITAKIEVGNINKMRPVGGYDLKIFLKNLTVVDVKAIGISNWSVANNTLFITGYNFSKSGNFEIGEVIFNVTNSTYSAIITKATLSDTEGYKFLKVQIINDIIDLEFIKKIIKIDNKTEKVIKDVDLIVGDRFNVTKLELETGDDLTIPVVVENITINETVIETLNEVKEKAKEIAPKSKDVIDEVIKELKENIKPLLSVGFNITNKTVKEEVVGNEVISKVKVKVVNTSNKGFAIITIPVGEFEVKNVTVNNGTENITLKEDDFTSPIGWYEVENDILKITIIKDPEINVILATTLPTTTEETTKKRPASLILGEDIAPAIRDIIYKARVMVGSDIDANLSAKCLKDTYEKVGKELNITDDCILIGGPIANPVVKKYMDKFPVNITNDYPGKNKGVIQVITLKVKVGENIYNYVTVVLLAGSDRWGTKAAVEYFKQLEDLPKEPIFVEWRDGKAVKIEKP